MTIDIDVATLLQAQLAISIGLSPDATIFQICAAIDTAGSIDIDVILSDLAATLLPIVTAQNTRDRWSNSSSSSCWRQPCIDNSSTHTYPL